MPADTIENPSEERNCLVIPAAYRYGRICLTGCGRDLRTGFTGSLLGQLPAVSGGEDPGQPPGYPLLRKSLK